MKEKQVAIGFVMFGGKLLMLQRKDKNPIWDKKWEYPGGKIEPGEDPADAVRREILEETGLEIDEVEFLGVHAHDWHLPEDILRVHLHCFVCDASNDHIEIEQDSAYTFTWILPNEIAAFDLLEANADITKRFLLPRLDV